eukprot:4192892-Prymnesium_polylepis.3
MTLAKSSSSSATPPSCSTPRVTPRNGEPGISRGDRGSARRIVSREEAARASGTARPRTTT